MTDNPKPKPSAGVRADQLCYARQYEWQSTFTFSRPKLKELIEVEIRAAEDAARLDERHKINDPYQKGWREGREPLEQENRILRGLVQTNPDWKCPHGRNVDNIGKCPDGFPGCACADDRIAVLCEDAARKPLEQKVAELETVNDAATELLEVADLRGDSSLPHPVDDPNLWTARMQDAWDELRAAIDAAKGGRRMAKCRGCGDDTRDYESPGLGWMHWKCEVERLTGLLEESEAIQATLERQLAEAKADLRNALALLRYCFDGDDIPVIYTVEELREWVKGDSGQGAIAAARGGEKDGE